MAGEGAWYSRRRPAARLDTVIGRVPDYWWSHGLAVLRSPTRARSSTGCASARPSTCTTGRGRGSSRPGGPGRGLPAAVHEAGEEGQQEAEDQQGEERRHGALHPAAARLRRDAREGPQQDVVRVVDVLARRAVALLAGALPGRGRVGLLVARQLAALSVDARLSSSMENITKPARMMSERTIEAMRSGRSSTALRYALL